MWRSPALHQVLLSEVTPGVCKVRTAHGSSLCHRPPELTLVITALPVTERVTSMTLPPPFCGLFLAYVNP